MTQIPILQPARWSRNGVRIVVVPGAELPRFRLEIEPGRAVLTGAFTGPFATVEEAECAAEAITSAADRKLSA
jgi:hypothetical protein